MSKIKKNKKEKDVHVVITKRCADMTSPSDDLEKRKCDECGEMTWISSDFRKRKVDKVICTACFYSKYKDKDYRAMVTEKSLDDAINMIELIHGNRPTREDVLKVIEDKIGKKIEIIK